MDEEDIVQVCLTKAEVQALVEVFNNVRTEHILPTELERLEQLLNGYLKH